MAYSHYQRSQPGWGTNQFQFGRPPTPGFQPQPSWGGNDFFRAHAASSYDPQLFDHAWNRVREYGGAPAGGMGVGLNEARIWHRRAYGTNELAYMNPEEVGHAAAYEAYRTWIHNSSIYEPLSGDIERQREALTGLAVAEATRLLGFSGRPLDQYARLTATEAAAHTASYIFYQTRDGEQRSRSRYRQGSVDDPYAFDDELLYPQARSTRSMSRHRSHSRHRSYSMSGSTPYHGSSYSPTMGSAMPQASYPGGYGGSYGGSMHGGSMHGGSMHGGLHGGSLHGSMHGGSGMPISPVSMTGGSVYGQPAGIPMSGSAYGAMPPISPTQYSAPMGMGVAPSYHSTMGVPMGHTRSRSGSHTYPQQYYAPQDYSQGYMPMSAPYMGSSASVSSAVPQGQMIVVHKPKKHKHRSSHRHSRGSDGEYDDHHSSRY